MCKFVPLILYFYNNQHNKHMKKLFFAAMMMLLSVTVGAQSLNGTWTLDKDYADAISKIAAEQEGNLKMELGMEFKESTVKVISWCTISAEAINMKMKFWVPGTFTNTNNQIVCTYDKSRTDFEIEDIQSDNEEFGAMLKDPGTKAMMLAMMKGEAKKEFATQLETFASLADEFDNFKVKSVDESTLVIENDGIEVTFTKR